MASVRNVYPTGTVYPELVKPTQYYKSGTIHDHGSTDGEDSIIITLSVLATIVGLVAVMALALFVVLYSYRRWRQLRANAMSTALDLSDASGLCIVFGGNY